MLAADTDRWELLGKHLGILHGHSMWNQSRLFTVRLVHVLHQYSTVQYSTVQYSTVQYRTVPYRTVPYRTVPYRTVPYRIVLYSTVQYSSVQQCLFMDILLFHKLH